MNQNFILERSEPSYDSSIMLFIVVIAYSQVKDNHGNTKTKPSGSLKAPPHFVVAMQPLSDSQCQLPLQYGGSFLFYYHKEL